MCPVISNGGTKFIMKLLDCGKIDKYPKIHSLSQQITIRKCGERTIPQKELHFVRYVKIK